MSKVSSNRSWKFRQSYSRKGFTSFSQMMFCTALWREANKASCSGPRLQAPHALGFCNSFDGLLTLFCSITIARPHPFTSLLAVFPRRRRRHTVVSAMLRLQSFVAARLLSPHSTASSTWPRPPFLRTLASPSSRTSLTLADLPECSVRD
jgi:hypothetical protein